MLNKIPKKIFKEIWFIAAEITKNTPFMMSPVCRFFLREWPKRGLGDKVKHYFTYFKGDFSQMWYIEKEFDAEAKFLTNRMIKNPAWALRLLDKTEEWAKRAMKEGKVLKNTNLHKLTNQKLIQLYKRLIKYQELHHGMGASVSWHADAHKERVTKALLAMTEKQIKKRKLDLNPATIFSLLSTPKEESFELKEEKDFLKVAIKINQKLKTKNIFKRVPTKSLAQKIKKVDLKTFTILKNHYKKYEWLCYQYKGPAYTFEYFLDRWKALFKGKDSPTKLYKDLIAKERKTKIEQNKILKKLKFSAYQLKLIKLTQRLVFIKAFRKDALYYGMYCLDPFFREAGKRIGLGIDQMRAMNAWEIPEALLKNKFNSDELNERLKEAIAYSDRRNYIILVGKEAKKFFKKIKKEKIISKKVKELTGTCASPGYAKGIVKIIETPEDMAKMKKGNILISETTYPALVPAMKKAQAIVTNAGGLTCHAAIVSREMNIPCIVGTKIANKVLKDGDRVEVNATKGVVKKL